MIKYYLIIVSTLLLYSPTTAEDIGYLIKYKPIKILKYKFHSPFIYSENWYNIRYSFYSAVENNNQIDISIQMFKDHSSCFGIGWLFPQNIKSNYTINHYGDLLSEQQTKSRLKIYRIIPLPIIKQIPLYNYYIPLVFPEGKIVVQKEYIFSNENIINNKSHHFEKIIVLQNVSKDNIAEFTSVGKFDKKESHFFKGLFDITNGNWKYYEFNIKDSNNNWKLLHKIEIDEIF